MALMDIQVKVVIELPEDDSVGVPIGRRGERAACQDY
jgi:transcription antitermination factor NusA-like protein